jgi:hypothetical protein
VTRLEDSNHADLTGFPPGLSAPIRPAVPRRTTSQLSALIDVDDDLDELELDDLDADDLGDDEDAGALPAGTAYRGAHVPVAPGTATVSYHI